MNTEQITQVLPGSDVSTIVHKGVSYTLEHLRTPSQDSIAVWKDDYLVGTADMYHHEECIDISYQKPEGDWHETNVLYNVIEDVISLAEYVIEC